MKKKSRGHTSPLRKNFTLSSTRGKHTPETEDTFMRPSEWLSTLKGETKEEKTSTTPSIPKIVELMNIKDHTSRVKSTVSIDEPLFRPSMSSVEFQNYEPFTEYKQKIYMCNSDSVSRRIVVEKPDSPYFSVSVPKTEGKGSFVGCKVAAGMKVAFTITFRPHEIKEYSYDLVCKTEREKFVIPVRAPGKRPCLDLPDEFRFGDCPVKCSKESTLLIRNIGTDVAKFTVHVDAPFTASVTKSNLVVGDVAQLNLGFCPPSSGTYEGNLVIQFAGSEKMIFVTLQGSGSDANVRLEQSNLNLGSQYISLRSHGSIRILNDSDVPVKFKWKFFANESRESEHRERLHDTLREQHTQELFDLENENDDDEVSTKQDETSKKVYALKQKYHTLNNRVDRVSKPFEHKNFVVEPSEGQIWSHSNVDINVSFLPDIAGSYECVAYLEIDGKEHRLPLRLTGEGIGPKATFSARLIDMGDIFVKTQFERTIKLVNRVCIPCEYALMRKDTPFGKRFKFTPERGTLGVGETHTIKIELNSDLLGSVCEDFEFSMQGTSETLKLRVKGEIVGPTFHFDAEKLDFGLVSHGFTSSQYICLYNTCEIPMKFRLRVLGDEDRGEFKIFPESATLEPEDRVEIRVDMIPMSVQSYECHLMIDVEDVGQGLLSVPIYAKVEVRFILSIYILLTLKYKQTFIHRYLKLPWRTTHYVLENAFCATDTTNRSKSRTRARNFEQDSRSYLKFRTQECTVSSQPRAAQAV